jgi:hypothetical protein
MAQETWNAFSEPYTIEQNGIQVHFFAVPKSLKVRDEVSIDQKLNLYIGMEGEMFSKIGEKPQFTPSVLPNISLNENQDNIFDVVLPLTLLYDDLNSYLNNAISGQKIRADEKTVIVPSNLKTQQYGDKILLGMDFNAIRNNRKEVSGKIYFAGKPVFYQDSESLRFSNIEFDVKSADFLSNWGIKSKRKKIQSQIEKLAVISLSGFLEEARTRLEQQGFLETGFARFKVLDPSLNIERIFTTSDDMQVYFRAKGKMDVQLKDFK